MMCASATTNDENPLQLPKKLRGFSLQGYDKTKKKADILVVRKSCRKFAA
jgi:hypothetical protein